MSILVVTWCRPKLSLVTDSSSRKDNSPTRLYLGAPPAGDQVFRDGGGIFAQACRLMEIENVNLTNAEVPMVGAIVRRSGAFKRRQFAGINITLHNFIVTPIRVHDWQAESKLSGVTLALEGWSAPVAFQSGQVTLSGGKMDAQFVADLAKAADIKGTLSIPDVEHPEVDFEMSASQLDIDKLIAAAGGGSTSTSATPAKAKAPSPPSGPSTLVANGHIKVEKITTKPYTVGPANVEMRVYTDRAELFPISIGMYGGTLQISSRVDRSTAPPRSSRPTFQMRNLDVSKVLAVTPSARGKMSGTGELDLQLLGNLSEEWKKTLSGTGKFAVRDGHLPGVNLAGIAQSLGKKAGAGRDTPFTVLEGDVNIASQRVSSNQIHLDSTLGIVDLKGSLGLDSTLDYRGTATVNPAAAMGSGALGSIVAGLFGGKVGKITVPFALAGTIGSPKISPGKGVTQDFGIAVPRLPGSMPAIPQPAAPPKFR